MSLAIKATGLTKSYKVGKNDYVQALGPVNLEIPNNSFTVIIGRSGSGKSTLLNLLTGLDKPSEGELIVNDQYLSKMNRSNIAKYRSSIGIIFQQYNLLPNLTAKENVMMGAWAGGNKVDEREALTLLDRFGIAHRAKAKVTTLSGGEKQRVAVCRSLISKPKILFCDEPTGALDSKNEENVRDILVDLHNEGITIVMVTHNLDFQNIGTQVLRLDDGLLTTLRASPEETSIVDEKTTPEQTKAIKEYTKSFYTNEDLWLFKDFLEQVDINNYLTSQLPNENLELANISLLSLKSIITEISDHHPGKKVFPFGFLPIAKDDVGGLIVYYLQDGGVYYLDKNIFFEDSIGTIRENENNIKTYETQSIIKHAEKAFQDLPTFLEAILSIQK